MADVPQILVITNRYPNARKPYGGHYVKSHALLHRRAGFGVEVIYPWAILLGRGDSLLAYGGIALRAMRSAIRGKFDLVHAHWPFPSGLIGLGLGLVRRKPLVITSHGAYVEEYNQLHPLLRWLVRLVLIQADAIIAVGHAHAETIERIISPRSCSLHVISMGIIHPERRLSRKQARLHLGLPCDGRIVAFIGNLIYAKGPDLLIEAASIMGEGSMPCYFVLVGQGPLAGELRARVRDLGLQDQVRFVGGVPHDEIYTWLFAADAIAVPSRRESFGLVPIEAMACGTTVVAADTGELARTIRHRVNGILVPPEDPAALAVALKEVLEDQELASALSAEGLRVASGFDLEQRARQVLDVYKRLLQMDQAGDGA